MQDTALLFLTGDLARLCLSSDLISFNYKPAAENVGVSGHRNFVVLFCEYFVAVCQLGGPGAGQIKCIGGKAEQDTHGTKDSCGRFCHRIFL